jgi:ubiquinone/menaquinone biosynthesis C-methylase UbiE
MDYSSKCSVYYEQERAEIAPFLPRDLGVLLDVGCGRGAFGALVKRDFGSEVWGIEPNSEAAKFAISRLDRVFIREFDEHLELPADYFDVVTFNDSLEHFPYPEPPLEFCKKNPQAWRESNLFYT